MSGSLAFLRLPQFWRFYVRPHDHRLDADALNLFGTTPINRRPDAEAVVSLRCGPDHLLDLKITPAPAMANLGLRNARTNASAEMGWWDDFRWHPYALRWSELERLHRSWLGGPPDAVPPGAAFLLLARFVGIGVDERDVMPARQAVLAEHYRNLDLFTPGEAAELSEHTVVPPSEIDYRWSQDGELGWVFGGEYPCYSLRNREHAGGVEGLFPFAEWATIVAELPGDGSAQ
jgi:hypothetical protein